MRNVGAFKIADAITADAHRMELAMLINFSWFFVMTDSDIRLPLSKGSYPD